jgi:hypothetical protein
VHEAPGIGAAGAARDELALDGRAVVVDEADGCGRVAREDRGEDGLETVRIGGRAVGHGAHLPVGHPAGAPPTS